jgi:NADPH-dependent glutamate synthase beta subunit-like oxidoreductase
MIIYRRDRAHMPAHDFEADEAEAEGIRINWLRTIRHIEETEFTVEEMQIDENGRPQPTGRLETLQADSLLLALGQNVDTTVLESIPGVRMEDGVVQVAGNMMTGAEGVFAGGDMVPSERTVAIATGHGKKAARHIDAWLRKETYHQGPRTPRVHFDDLNLGYFAAAQQRLQTSLPVEARVRDFSEITAGLDQTEARFEAARCYSCGNCFECDGCYGACPERAIRKLGPGDGYVIDYGLCTGCEACVSQCPCNAMAMVAVNSQDASRGDAP